MKMLRRYGANRAFTLVELIVVVATITVLATIGIVGYNRVETATRDASRASDATSIAEALEKFFDRHGEYPSCSELITDPIATLDGLDADSLTTPTSSDISLVCGEATSANDGDYYYYNGTPAECMDEEVRCETYTIDYTQEEDNNVVRIIGRRDTQTADLTSDISLSVTTSGLNAIGTANSTCSDNSALTVQIRYNINGGNWSSWVTSVSRTVAGTQGYEYFFQARVNCSYGRIVSDWVESDIESVIVDAAAPTGTLTMSAAISGSNAVGTAGGGSCASGTTLVREIRYQGTATSTAGTWSSYLSGATRVQAANQGWRYTFQQRARCEGASSNSSWVTSATAYTTRSIATPSAPTASVSTSGTTTTFTRTNITCPTGLTVSYQRQAYRESYTGSWVAISGTAFTWDTTSQGWNYRGRFQSKCSSYYTASAWSAESNSASYIRPVSNPSGPASNFKVTVPSDRRSHTWTWTAPTCGSGAQYWSSGRSYVSSGLIWVDTGASGWSSWGTWGFWSATATIPMTGTTTIPSGATVQRSERYKCINATTLRESSSYTTGTSALITL